VRREGSIKLIICENTVNRIGQKFAMIQTNGVLPIIKAMHELKKLIIIIYRNKVVLMRRSALSNYNERYKTDYQLLNG
jgi:hypothetical protein